VRLTNAGAQSVDVSGFRIAFTAMRDGVSFECKEHVGGSALPHEPAWLVPGQSFAFERDLDCTMPLPGRYEIGVYVALRLADPADSVGAFALQVESRGDAPRPYPSRPALYVSMTGAHATHPLAPEAWFRGDYKVVLAVVNAGREPIRVGPARLAFLTYKKGSPLACAGQAESIALPDELASGAIHVARAPIACAPSEEGRYEVVGRFQLRDGDEIEVGRVPLNVTRDPLLFGPEPWPPLEERPRSWLK
jgi:hypothetical protein